MHTHHPCFHTYAHITCIQNRHMLRCMHPCTHMYTHEHLHMFTQSCHECIHVLTRMHVHSCMHTYHTCLCTCNSYKHTLHMHAHTTPIDILKHTCTRVLTLRPNQVSVGHPFPFWPRNTAVHLPNPSPRHTPSRLSPPCFPHSDTEQAVPSL